MNARSSIWLWISAAVAMIAGFLLVMNDSSAGWFLVIMGIVDIGVAAGTGRGLVAADRGIVRWGLIAATLLIVVLALIAGAVLLLK